MDRSVSLDYQQVLPARVQEHLSHRYRRTRLMILHRVQQQHDVTVQVIPVARSYRNNTNNFRDIVRAPGNRLRGLPGWSEEFTENMEDERVLASSDTPANTSHDSDSERPAKVVSRKHSIFTYFPKDRICEVRKRTKSTVGPCRKCTCDAVLRTENFGDMITADHEVLNDGGEPRNNHRYASHGTRVSHSMDTILSVRNKNFSGDGKEFSKVSRAVGEAESHSIQTILSNLAKRVKNYHGIILHLPPIDPR